MLDQAGRLGSTGANVLGCLFSVVLFLVTYFSVSFLKTGHCLKLAGWFAPQFAHFRYVFLNQRRVHIRKHTVKMASRDSFG